MNPNPVSIFLFNTSTTKLILKEKRSSFANLIQSKTNEIICLSNVSNYTAPSRFLCQYLFINFDLAFNTLFPRPSPTSTFPHFRFSITHYKLETTPTHFQILKSERKIIPPPCFTFTLQPLLFCKLFNTSKAEKPPRPFYALHPD